MNNNQKKGLVSSDHRIYIELIGKDMEIRPAGGRNYKQAPTGILNIMFEKATLT